MMYLVLYIIIGISFALYVAYKIGQEDISNNISSIMIFLILLLSVFLWLPLFIFVIIGELYKKMEEK